MILVKGSRSMNLDLIIDELKNVKWIINTT